MSCAVTRKLYYKDPSQDCDRMEIKNRYRSINSPDSGYQSLLFPATLFADVLTPVLIAVAFL